MYPCKVCENYLTFFCSSVYLKFFFEKKRDFWTFNLKWYPSMYFFVMLRALECRLVN